MKYHYTNIIDKIEKKLRIQIIGEDMKLTGV